MSKNNNVFLIGPMGAGKSTVGAQLAKRLGLRFYDTDQMIESRTGVDLSWIYSVEGEIGFRRREHLIIDEFTQLTDIVLSTGGGSIIEEKNRSLLKNNGFVIYLTTSTPEQFNRTQRNRKRRPELQVDDLEDQILKLMAKLTPLYEEIADLMIHTDKKNVSHVVKEIIQHLPKWSLHMKQDED